MSTQRNPFKPTAGAMPPLLVGRSTMLDEFSESLDDGPGAPARLARFTGARGAGKTVMLSEIRDLVLKRGWVSLSETATPGLVERLAEATALELERLAPGEAPKRRIQEITLPSVLGVGGGSLKLEAPAQTVTNLRRNITLLLDVLEQHQTGLLITVDEIHRAALEDLRSLTTTYQHLVTEGRDVALAFAGLPSAVSDMLNDDVLTFLRRAEAFELNDVPLDEVRSAFQATLEETERSISDEALDLATQATGGYPFMIQLVGYHMWRKAIDKHIDVNSVEQGIATARRRLGSLVHATALADLSDVDRTFLIAMARDDGPSRISDIQRRLGATRPYTGQYRLRLLEAGVIQSVGYGRIDFTMPYLREYLRDDAASQELTTRPSPSVTAA